MTLRNVNGNLYYEQDRWLKILRDRNLTRTWRERANCYGMDIDIFYDEANAHENWITARETCAACCVIDQCRREYDIIEGSNEPHGFVGGESASQRLKQRGIRLRGRLYK